MPDTRSFKVGEDIYDIKEEEVNDFLSSFEGATEIKSFKVGEDVYDIRLDEVDDFKLAFPEFQDLSATQTGGIETPDVKPLDVEQPEPTEMTPLTEAPDSGSFLSGDSMSDMNEFMRAEALKGISTDNETTQSQIQDQVNQFEKAEKTTETIKQGITDLDKAKAEGKIESEEDYELYKNSISQGKTYFNSKVETDRKKEDLANLIQSGIDMGYSSYKDALPEIKRNAAKNLELNDIDRKEFDIVNTLDRLEVKKRSGAISDEDYTSQVTSLKKQKESILDERFEDINEEIADIANDISSGEFRDDPEATEEAKRRLADLRFKKENFFSNNPETVAKTIAGESASSQMMNFIDIMPEDLDSKEKFETLFMMMYKDTYRKAEKLGWTDDGEISPSAWSTFKGFYDLSNEEKEVVKSYKETMALKDLFLFNRFTEEEAGFFQSTWQSFSSMLGGDIYSAWGVENGFAHREIANITNNFIQESGLDEMVSKEGKEALNELGQAATFRDGDYSESFGNLVGMLGGIATLMRGGDAALSRIGKAGAYISNTKAVNNLKKVYDSSKVANSSAVKFTKNVYDKAINASPILTESVKEGLRFEATGEMFKKNEDIFNFSSGLFGALASNTLKAGIGAGVDRLGRVDKAKEAFNRMSLMYGDKTVQAAAKVGDFFIKTNTRGAGEAAEELAQELVSVFQTTEGYDAFKAELKRRFPDSGAALEFFAVSFLTGSVMGGSQKNSAYDNVLQKKYDELSEADKAAADDIVEEHSRNMADAINGVALEMEQDGELKESPVEVQGTPVSTELEAEVTQQEAEVEQAIGQAIGQDTEQVEETQDAETQIDETIEPTEADQVTGQVTEQAVEQVAEAQDAETKADEVIESTEVDQATEQVTEQVTEQDVEGQQDDTQLEETPVVEEAEVETEAEQKLSRDFGEDENFGYSMDKGFEKLGEVPIAEPFVTETDNTVDYTYIGVREDDSEYTYTISINKKKDGTLGKRIKVSTDKNLSEEDVEARDNEFEEIKNLDPKDETNLKKLSNFLGNIEKDLDEFGQGTLGVNLPVVVSKAVVKLLKKAVDAGVTLEQAIKDISTNQKFKLKNEEGKVEERNLTEEEIKDNLFKMTRSQEIAARKRIEADKVKKRKDKLKEVKKAAAEKVEKVAKDKSKTDSEKKAVLDEAKKDVDKAKADEKKASSADKARKRKADIEKKVGRVKIDEVKKKAKDTVKTTIDKQYKLIEEGQRNAKQAARKMLQVLKSKDVKPALDAMSTTDTEALFNQLTKVGNNKEFNKAMDKVQNILELNLEKAEKLKRDNLAKEVKSNVSKARKIDKRTLTLEDKNLLSSLTKGINVSNLDEKSLNEYNEILENFINTRTGKIKSGEAIEISKVIAKAKDLALTSESNDVKSLISKNQDLFESGIIDTDMSASDIRAVVNAIKKDGEISPSKSKTYRESLKSSIAQSKRGIKAGVLNQDVLSSEQEAVIEEMFSLDLDKISLKDMRLLNNVLGNVMVNGELDIDKKVENLLGAELEKAKRLAEKKVKDKSISKINKLRKRAKKMAKSKQGKITHADKVLLDTISKDIKLNRLTQEELDTLEFTITNVLDTRSSKDEAAEALTTEEIMNQLEDLAVKIESREVDYLLEANKELVNQGVLDNSLTSTEIKTILDAVNKSEKDGTLMPESLKDREQKFRDFINASIDRVKVLVKEDIDLFSPRHKTILNKIMSHDLTNMPTSKLIKLNNILLNANTNRDIDSYGDILSDIKKEEKIKKLQDVFDKSTLRKITNVLFELNAIPKISKLGLKNLGDVSSIFTRISADRNVGKLIDMIVSGDIRNANKEVNRVYEKSMEAMDKIVRKHRRNLKREDYDLLGLYGFLNQEGNFEDRKSLLESSIENQISSTEKSVSEKGVELKEIFDKEFKNITEEDFKNIKLKDGLKEFYDYTLKWYSERESKMAQQAESEGRSFTSVGNYLPNQTRKVDSESVKINKELNKLDSDSLKLNESISDKTSDFIRSRKAIDKLPPNLYYNLDPIGSFKMGAKGIEYDIKTMEARKVIKNLLNDPRIIELLGGLENVNIIKDRMINVVSSQREIVPNDIIRNVLSPLTNSQLGLMIGDFTKYITEGVLPVMQHAIRLQKGNPLNNPVFKAMQHSYSDKLNELLEKTNSSVLSRDNSLGGLEQINKLSRGTNSYILDTYGDLSKALNKFSTFSLSQGDKMAARAIWLSSYIDNLMERGKIKTPDDFDMDNPIIDDIAANSADSEISSSINTSERDQMGSLFSSSKGNRDIMSKLFFPLKKFAIRQAFDINLSLRNLADSSSTMEGRIDSLKRLTAAVGGMAAFHSFALYVRQPLFNWMSDTLLESMGYEDEDDKLSKREKKEKDDKKSKLKFEKLTARILNDLIAAPLPSQIEEGGQELIDNWLEGIYRESILKESNGNQKIANKKLKDNPYQKVFYSDLNIWSLFGAYGFPLEQGQEGYEAVTYTDPLTKEARELDEEFKALGYLKLLGSVGLTEGNAKRVVDNMYRKLERATDRTIDFQVKKFKSDSSSSGSSRRDRTVRRVDRSR